MKRRRFLTVTVGVMVLSVGLVLLVGERVAQAVPPDKSKPNQSWDENLPSAQRFTVLSAFGGAAVRDNNTGLVWEQAPDPHWGNNPLTPNGITNWYGAIMYCVGKTVGGTFGWRLPSVVELFSVLDPSLPSPNKVPATVFTLSGPQFFWSSTTALASGNPSAWVVGMNGTFIADGKVFIGDNAWCVRGPMNESVY
jgi:hypothetical protein